ncbi:MAG: HU family DNA-binding protein [Mollicutes bacterium]|nr:HU family DNA-binding protein [Mollicutes bacterium]
MTKTELVEVMATKAGLTKADAARALDAFQEAVTGALKKGQKVTLVGFGSFDVKKRAARVGRNPQTGAEVKISARNVASFKVGSKLKEAIN